MRFFFFALFLPTLSVGQGYVQGYFTMPIRPGQENLLAGTMGELRPNHFHGGIDIKTEQRTGLPVYAAAKGYIERIKVSNSGYGNVLYLKHPNGYSSVYAHLLRFSDSLANWVRDHQYRQKTFEIELFPPAEMFGFNQLDTIAYSGNSGSSSGPHLHFEIRDFDEAALNPLQFGFPEIRDDIPPVISKIAFNTTSAQSRVAEEFGTIAFRLQFGPEGYYLKDTVNVFGEFTLSMLAYDMANGASNKNGINRIRVELDDQIIYSNTLQRISFDEMRYINVHHDYVKSKASGERFTRLFVADGNKLDIYVDRDCAPDRILLEDTLVHTIRIWAWDARDNLSTAKLHIRNQEPRRIIPFRGAKTLPGPIEHELYENILKITARNTALISDALLYAGSTKLSLPMAYSKNHEAIYLWDLRKGLPDSIEINGKVRPFNFLTQVLPRKRQVFAMDNLVVRFENSSLYDTLYLPVIQHEPLSTRHFQDMTIGDFGVPLHTAIEVSLKPVTEVVDKERTRVFSYNGKYLTYEGGSWNRDYLVFKTKNMGRFVIASDTVEPAIVLISKTSKAIKFKISDDLSGIRSFSASINGKWVLMNYDSKTKLLWSELLSETDLLRGEFILEVTDMVGNKKTFKTTL